MHFLKMSSLPLHPGNIKHNIHYKLLKPTNDIIPGDKRYQTEQLLYVCTIKL